VVANMPRHKGEKKTIVKSYQVCLGGSHRGTWAEGAAWNA